MTDKIPNNLFIPIPQEVYDSPEKLCAMIVDVNERLSNYGAIEKALKDLSDRLKNIALDQLSATGQKHFAFDFGTFAKSTKTNISFPTAENGGREKAIEWLKELVDRGVISFDEVLYVQQARVSNETVLAIEQAVTDYNEKHKYDPSFQPLPESPFNKYEQVTLTSPRKRKTA